MLKTIVEIICLYLVPTLIGEIIIIPSGMLITFILQLGCQCLQFNVLNSGNVYPFTTLENSDGNGEPLGTVTCTEDGGASVNGPVTYAILQPGSLPFVLDGNFGALSLKTNTVLDYEEAQQYLFNVSCAYISDPSVVATAVVRFSVGPVNEFLPTLSDVSLTVSITETTPVGTTLVARDVPSLVQYTASDNDDGLDGELQFIPRPDAVDLVEFGLYANGSLVLLQAIDLDTGGDVQFRQVIYDIIVCDGNRNEQECPSVRITIFILSANDNPPIFEQDEYTVSVPETAVIGTSLITVVCTDADRNGVGELMGIFVDSSAPVEIPNEKNGTVFLKANLDYENVSVLTVNLVCPDSSFQDTAVLVVNIEAENDNWPQFTQALYKFHVDRLSFTGLEIGKILATDADRNLGNDIVYRLMDNGMHRFILSSGGTLVLNKFVFLFEGSSFDLLVEASDGVFNTTSSVIIVMTGLFSVPEIVIIIVSGILFVFVLILVFIYCCYSQKERYYLCVYFHNFYT